MDGGIPIAFCPVAGKGGAGVIVSNGPVLCGFVDRGTRGSGSRWSGCGTLRGGCRRLRGGCGNWGSGHCSRCGRNLGRLCAGSGCRGYGRPGDGSRAPGSRKIGNGRETCQQHSRERKPPEKETATAASLTGNGFLYVCPHRLRGSEFQSLHLLPHSFFKLRVVHRSFHFGLKPNTCISSLSEGISPARTATGKSPL